MIRQFLGLFLTVAALSFTAYGQTPVFTYQGKLTDGVSPANGTYEMQFKLFDSLAGPTQIGSTITNSSVTVTNGVFTVNLDFSPATPFSTGADRFLEISVRKAADPPGFTTLTPRQQITSTPYATRANVAGNALALQGSPVSSTAPVPNQVLKFTGGQWTPGADIDTTYTAGSGLQLSGTTFSADLAVVQARVSTSCTVDVGFIQAMTGIAANGTPSCSSVLPTAGGTMSGNINMGTNTLIGTTAAIDFTNFDVSAGGVVLASNTVTVAPTSAVGIGLDVSDADIIYALNVGDNTIIGTTAAIDFAGFDVSSNGEVRASKLTIDGAGGATTAIDVSDPFVPTALNVGANMIVGSTAAIGFTNFDVSSAGDVTVGGKFRLGLRSSDPAGTIGLMYYNTATNKFRCYEGGAWKDCIGSVMLAAPDIAEQQEVGKLRQQVQRQQAQIDALKKLLCSTNANADVCKPEE